MLTMTIDKMQLQELKDLLGPKGQKRLNRELAIAMRATAKKTVSIVTDDVYSELNATKGEIKKRISSKVYPDANNPHATVTLKHEKRIPISKSAFAGRHNRPGVAFKISRKGSRKTVRGSFMGPRPGITSTKLKGRAYRRLGKSRYPIVRLDGASPWGVYKKRNLVVPTKAKASAELQKQVQRRIRFLTLKRSGVI